MYDRAKAIKKKVTRTKYTYLTFIMSGDYLFCFWEICLYSCACLMQLTFSTPRALSHTCISRDISAVGSERKTVCIDSSLLNWNWCLSLKSHVCKPHNLIISGHAHYKELFILAMHCYFHNYSYTSTHILWRHTTILNTHSCNWLNCTVWQFFHACNFF